MLVSQVLPPRLSLPFRYWHAHGISVLSGWRSPTAPETSLDRLPQPRHLPHRRTRIHSTDRPPSAPPPSLVAGPQRNPAGAARTGVRRVPVAGRRPVRATPARSRASEPPALSDLLHRRRAASHPPRRWWIAAAPA